MSITQLKGLFVGMLDEDEMREFRHAVKDGLAYRDYDHAGGFLGLAKVGIPEKPTRLLKPGR